MKHSGKALLVLLIAAIGVGQTSQVVVTTPSMEPNLRVHDLLIVDGSYYSTKSVQRFDIVTFKHPKGDFKAVARIIALGGETVALSNNVVFINGKALKESFKTRPCGHREEDPAFPCANFGPIKVPEGEFFLLADNRAESLDSRIFNPHTIRQNQLLGKVVRIISNRKNRR